MRLYSSLLAVVLAGCSSGDDVPAPPQGAPAHDLSIEEDLFYDFGPFELAPGMEDSATCVSWTLDNDAPLYVNAVELASGPGFHHSNWFFVPEDRYDGPDGFWPCAERGFDAIIAAGTGGVLTAQSTQSTSDVQQFPPHVAIPIAPRSRIVAEVHMLNTTPNPLSTKMTVGLDTEPAEDVEVKLAALELHYEPLALPPLSKSSVSTSCNLTSVHEEQMGRPLDFSIYYILSHYHELGTGARLEAFGPNGDEVLYDLDSAIGEPLGISYDEPLDLTGFEGLRFSCLFDNDRPDTVGWGIGDQEMCVMLAFTDSERLWGGGALGDDAGEPTMDSGVAQFEHSCFVISYPAERF